MLTGKVCIVTGGSRGIGKAISQVFAQNGAIVYAVATRVGSVEEWSADFNQGVSGEVRSVYFDISDEKACREAVMQVKRECDHIDGLVNNAGVEFNELIGMISRINMEKMFSVNVYGTINMLQIVSRIMGRQENGGSIVNIASMTALRGNRGQLVYSATKGAVVSLTKSAAKELAEKKIRINAIAPGLTNTDMMKQADPEKLQNRINNICMGRLAEPEDIAKACMFMVSDLSTYVSGQVLAVDGCTIM
ncbi:MAG: SDR family oxidoreductase [Oscillospiraceae bacterium]|nr:SDR family oxidoreductase [Oscillospiraceae bacterium]